MKSARALRVGTVNVRTLMGRAAEVLRLAVEWEIGILLVQEARLPRDSFGALRNLATKFGWHLVIHEQGLAPSGAAQWGCITLARWPVEPLPKPQWLPDGRGGVMRVWRPRARPLLLCNLYLPASSRTEAGDILQACFEHVAALGEDALLMGDFNLTEGDFPISDALACGAMRSANEAIHGDSPPPPTFRGPGGHYTRCIDFALHTDKLVIDYKHQVVGPADHDLVFYDVQLATDWRPEPFRIRPPRQVVPVQVSVKEWNDVWSSRGQTFHDALGRGEVDEAWSVLSAAAEDVMHAGGKARRRAEAPVPVRGLPPSTKAPTVQTLLERRLRRLMRRVAEAMLRDHDSVHYGNLLRKVWRQAEGHGFGATSLPELLEEVQKAADAEALETKQRLVAQWRERMAVDIHQVSRWVTRAAPPPLHRDGEWTAPLETSEKLEQAREVWERWWGSDADYDHEATAALLESVPAGPACADDALQFTPDELAAVVKRRRKRATGLDGWAAAQLTCLPCGFWVQVVELWQAMLQVGRVPLAWKRIRIALVPKPDGTQRPLAIGAVLWRALASLACRRLRDWATAAFPSDIHGGVVGRSLHGVHDALLRDLERTHGGRCHLLGVKTDVKKFFDSVRPQQAVDVALHMGFPGALAAVVRDFYVQQDRFLMLDGVVHPRPIRVACGLQQGCPLSVTLVNCLMTVWHAVVKQAAPSLTVKIFVDDRTCWSLDTDAELLLTDAVTAGRRVDAVFNLRLCIPTNRPRLLRPRWLGGDCRSALTS